MSGKTTWKKKKRGREEKGREEGDLAVKNLNQSESRASEWKLGLGCHKIKYTWMLVREIMHSMTTISFCHLVYLLVFMLPKVFTIVPSNSKLTASSKVFHETNTEPHNFPTAMRIYDFESFGAA